ncbi:MAG: hypothetical protein MR778_02180 [Clostridiales bacterium]|nr:hypothetical protein [Clostridiales bacterium]
MAEISSLLSLITDDNTRVALIDQMERMFDAAADEERLIQEIGNPTKVAVALIRYADSGKITPAAAPVVAPERVQPPKKAQPIDETKFRPAEDVVLDTTAAAPGDSFAPEDEPYSDDGYYSEEDAQYQDDGYYSEADAQYQDDGYYSEEDAQYQDDGYYPEEDAQYQDDGYYSEDDAQYQDDGYYSEDDAQYQDDGYYSEDDAQYQDDGYYSEEDDQYQDDGYYSEDDGMEPNPFTEMFDDLEAETVTKTNPFLAILYTIGAIIVGVPVFAVLLVLNLCFFAIGVAAVAAGVGLIGTAFIGLSVVADMLILLGGGASVFAVALVLLWFSIWFFIQVTIGWIRALVRLGKRWCCKEVEVA